MEEREVSEPESSATEHSTAVGWITLIYFCSGVCSLIDEVVWVRLLKLTLGNTVYASSIVVSMFMGGLALGALIMGRYADRVRRRLRLYALLEVCATMSALALPWLLRVADFAYRWFYVRFHPAPAVLLLVQVLVSGCILLAPAMVMGSTLPLLGRYVTALQEKVGRFVGRLYALNMLGAALGCFLAGFFLMRIFGVMETLYIAAGINLLVAFGGWVLSRSYEFSSEVTTETRTVSKGAEETGWGRYLLVGACFGSGLICIGYELIWMRSIIFLLGGFTYVFSAVLTMYLLGNVAGAGIGSWLSKRLRYPGAGFGVSLAVLGVFGVSYVPGLMLWSSVLMPVFENAGFYDLPGMHRTGTMLPIFTSVFLFFLPSLTMGIGFPLALQAWSNYRHKVGQATGTVYGVNTIGAVLGGVATGFLLIPSIGVQLSITVLGLAAIWLGGVMVPALSRRVKLSSRLAFLAVTAAVTVGALVIPSDLFRRQFIRLADTTLKTAKEGVTTTVSVHEKPNGEKTLRTSGVIVAGDERSTFRVPQKLLGHLGIFLNKHTRQVVTIGFGSGETTACMSLHGVERIDAVELSPELVEVALEYFSHLNLGGRLDEKVNMIYMDGKNYLHLTDRRYDLIVNDCINPKRFAENASLYTKEYFQDALNHLDSGGLFATYLPVTEMSTSCTYSALGTFVEVFPYVTVWFPSTVPGKYDFWYVTGSKDPQSLSPKHIDEELANKGVGDSAGYVYYLNSHYVLSCYLGDQDDLKIYLNLKGYELNSDYYPYIEFNSDKNEKRNFKKQWFAEFLANVRREGIFEYIDWSGISKDEQQKWRKEHEQYLKASTYLLACRGPTDISRMLEYSFDGFRIMPQHPGLIEQNEHAWSYATDALKKGRIDNIAEKLNVQLQRRPDLGPAWRLKSWVLQHNGDMDAALHAGEKAIECASYCPISQNNMGMILSQLKKTDEAIRYFEEAIRLKPDNAMYRFNLGVALEQVGRIDEGIAQYRRGLEIDPDNLRALCDLGELLAEQGQMEEAAKNYQQALEISPGYERAQRLLGVR